jgi:hypothetical protein
MNIGPTIDTPTCPRLVGSPCACGKPCSTYKESEQQMEVAKLRAVPIANYQIRVSEWMHYTFGVAIAADLYERNHRFFEEATELVQACGMTASEAHQLVDYTFGRPVGDAFQEVGGVSVTLAALCNANSIDLKYAANVELLRCWRKADVIRAKQAAKPLHSPLPETALTVADYKVMLEDHKRLVRELDVAINGEAGAAKQASLCDIVAQVRSQKISKYNSENFLAIRGAMGHVSDGSSEAVTLFQDDATRDYFVRVGKKSYFHSSLYALMKELKENYLDN